MKQRGLGDTVKAALKAVGVEKECEPCQKRQEFLNEVVNYSRIEDRFRRYIPKKDRNG